MSEQQLLTVMVPFELRDDFIDALIACDLLSGFSMTATAGYSREHSQYDIREQVEGYRDFSRFDVMHDCIHEEELIAHIRATFVASKIRYWITPVLSQGHL